MDKHPFFMKTAPTDGEQLHPLMEGLQNLKYDPNENTAEELANNYKEDGNFYIKHKKYRMAVMSYTEGLNQKTGNNDIDSTLLNNRSAAHYMLKNYRSSIEDAQKCLELKSDYLKAKIRAAKCFNAIEKFDDCISLCDEILHDNTDNNEISELRKACVVAKTVKERNDRKKAAENRRKMQENQKLISEIKKRNIKFDGEGELDEKKIQPRLAPLVDFPVSLDVNGCLSWPIVFCYPEFLKSDFHQQIHETTM